MLDFDKDRFCYGCGACANACPAGAITMEENAEGFLFPVIDADMCARCQKCEDACPHLSPVPGGRPLGESVCKAVFLKDARQRQASASGGVFLPMAEAVLEKGGYVCGCVWNRDLEAQHIVTNDRAQVLKMRGSKYVQSRMGDCYSKIRRLLQKGNEVLFTGTPCQVGGCLSSLGGRPGLVTCAVVCEGCPSPKVWRKYKAYLDERCGGKLVGVNFRDKRRLGWTVPYATFGTGTREYAQLAFLENPFVAALIEGLTYRKSCYFCGYKGDGHNADIIIGDLWRAEHRLVKLSGDMGISAVILRTSKGEALFNRIAPLVYDEPAQIRQIGVNNPPLTRPAKYHPGRDAFFRSLDCEPVQKLLKRHIRVDRKKALIKKTLIRLHAYRALRDIHHFIKAKGQRLGRRMKQRKDA